MTIYEANRRHNIPLEVLQEYEKWQLPGTENKCPGKWQKERLNIITHIRENALEEIHIREEWLAHLDYLRSQTKKAEN